MRGRKDNRDPLAQSLSNALGALQLGNGHNDTFDSLLGSPDVSINPFLETSVPLGQSLKAAAIFGTTNGIPRAPGSRPRSRSGSRPGSRSGSRPNSPHKRSKSAQGPRNTVNLYGMETKLDIIEISEWPLNAKKDKDASSNNPTPRKRAKSQSGGVSACVHLTSASATSLSLFVTNGSCSAPGLLRRTTVTDILCIGIPTPTFSQRHHQKQAPKRIHLRTSLDWLQQPVSSPMAAF